MCQDVFWKVDRVIVTTVLFCHLLDKGRHRERLSNLPKVRDQPRRGKDTFGDAGSHDSKPQAPIGMLRFTWVWGLFLGVSARSDRLDRSSLFPQ